ncbi:MAG: DUF4215 domain-containing protein [Bdellovibrionales bacterium]|nr:DUF4215 domain-containing protein [Bdellovibrionales bacterium]
MSPKQNSKKGICRSRILSGLVVTWLLTLFWVSGCADKKDAPATGSNSPVCGNGAIASPETCDDGNAVSGDGCSSSCTVEGGYACSSTPSFCISGCGNGVVHGSEACDDGNASSGDGCSSSCTVESGYTCTGSPSTCTI